MKVKVNNKIVDGAAGTVIGCATIFLVGAIFIYSITFIKSNTYTNIDRNFNRKSIMKLPIDHLNELEERGLNMKTENIKHLQRCKDTKQINKKIKNSLLGYWWTLSCSHGFKYKERREGFSYSV